MPAFFRNDVGIQFSLSSSAPAICGPPSSTARQCGSRCQLSLRMVFILVLPAASDPTMSSASFFPDQPCLALSVNICGSRECSNPAPALTILLYAAALSVDRGQEWKRCCWQVRPMPRRCWKQETTVAPRIPAMVEISSSREGTWNTASTPATSSAFSPIGRREMTNVAFSLANSGPTLGCCHGAFGIGQNGHTVRRSCNAFRMAFRQGQFWRACFWANTHGPARRRERRARSPANQQLSGDVVANHKPDARAFERFGRARRPKLSFWA